MAFKLRGDVVTQKPEIKAMPVCPTCHKYHSGQCQQAKTQQTGGGGTNVQDHRQ